MEGHPEGAMINVAAIKGRHSCYHGHLGKAAIWHEDIVYPAGQVGAVPGGGEGSFSKDMMWAGHLMMSCPLLQATSRWIGEPVLIPVPPNDGEEMPIDHLLHNVAQVVAITVLMWGPFGCPIISQQVEGHAL